MYAELHEFKRFLRACRVAVREARVGPSEDGSVLWRVHAKCAKREETFTCAVTGGVQPGAADLLLSILKNVVCGAGGGLSAEQRVRIDGALQRLFGPHYNRAMRCIHRVKQPV